MERDPQDAVQAEIVEQAAGSTDEETSREAVEQEAMQESRSGEAAEVGENTG